MEPHARASSVTQEFELMTMLDRMRRHKAWLKWSLALVVLTFVVFYIPDFLQPAATTGATGREVVADVNGDELYAAEFRNRYSQQMQAYRAQLGQPILQAWGMTKTSPIAAVCRLDANELSLPDEEQAERVRRVWCETWIDPDGDGTFGSAWVYGRYIRPA